MKRRSHFSWKQLLLVIVSPILLVSGCDQMTEDLADELARELQNEVDQQVQSAQESAQQWVKDRANEIWEDITRPISDWWDKTRTETLASWESAWVDIGLGTPAMVGEVAFAQTQLDHDVIKEAFVNAYKEFAFWESLGEPDEPVAVYGAGLLVQYFHKGDTRSAIIMPDDPGEKHHVAYALPGDWLTKYEAIGGTESAGYPSSKPESPSWFRQGKRQTFVLPGSGSTYALMQASGGDEIHLVPPAFYEAYQEQDGLSRLGYPLSSFPLDMNAGNDAWIYAHDKIDPATVELLKRWNSQPYQIQIFEKGSLWRIKKDGKFEVVERLTFLGGKTKVSEHVGQAFGNRYIGIQYSAVDECYIQTIRHVANAANGDFGSDVLRELALVPLKSSLTGATMAANSAFQKVALGFANYMLTWFKEGSISEANKSLVAGLILDAMYAKAVGDYLSTPLTDITWDIYWLNYKSILKDRIVREMTVEADHGKNRWNTQLDMESVIIYDPLTHNVSGVITSQGGTCDPATYVFQFRLDDDPAHETSSFLNRGELFVYDLESGREMP